MEEVVKMSTKGQLVVPQEFRKTELFEPGDLFLPIRIEGGIAFKKINKKTIENEFQKLSEEIELKFKKNKVSSTDIEKAKKWARKQY